MPPGRGRLLERADRLVQPGEDVRRAERRDARDVALEVANRAERLRLHDPVRRLVEGHDAQLVARGQGGGRAQDRLLADVDLAHAGELPAATAAAVERVAVAGVHRARTCR